MRNDRDYDKVNAPLKTATIMIRVVVRSALSST